MKRKVTKTRASAHEIASPSKPSTRAVATTTWWVYVLLSYSKQRTYVGITVDVERRLQQHNGELPGGAKSTRAGAPWSIGATYGPYPSRAEASRNEWSIKRLSGAKRLRWSAPDPSEESR